MIRDLLRFGCPDEQGLTVCGGQWRALLVNLFYDIVMEN